MRRFNLRNLVNLLAIMFVSAALLTSCTKEGPMGPAGKDGANGADGKDANENCKTCHNPNVVEKKAAEFELSKHGYGEAAFEEAGNAGCAPCHESEGFKYVCKNNTSTTFVLANGKYTNPYAATSSTAFGEITCNTCHSSLHTNYLATDFFPLTTTAAVPLTMWGGTKSGDLTQGGGSSNLCIKCHQPRPLTASAGDGNVLDYAAIAAAPTTKFYDASDASVVTKLKPGYRTHVHYGSVGAIYLGKGGVEFAGTQSYTNSRHTTVASCADCHMADMTGAAGGHTFKAKGNFNGCNTAACHGTGALNNANVAKWTTPRNAIKSLLDQVAAKLKIGGVEIMNRNPTTDNLWVGLTTNNYDGYLNIYDPVNNPNGLTNNPGGTFQNPSPSSSWTAEQKATNTALPKITLTNAQIGAIINFQMCLREYSLGIHNYPYSSALLTNTLGVL